MKLVHAGGKFTYARLAQSLLYLQVLFHADDGSECGFCYDVNDSRQRKLNKNSFLNKRKIQQRKLACGSSLKDIAKACS